MANGGNNQSFLSISGILALIALVGVTVFVPKELKSIRPAIDKVAGGVEKVDARLWQDPFQAFSDALSKDTVFPRNTFPAPKKSFTILGVMLPGGPYAEDREERIRRRYSIVAGLSHVKCYPKDPGHLEVLNYVKHVRGNTWANIPVLFEEYISKSHDPVLVVWIDEDAFSNGAFFQTLDDMFASAGIVKSNVKVIGPTSSSQLRNLIMEISTSRRDWRNEYQVYSATASTEGIFLSGRLYSKTKNIEVIRGKDNHISIARVTKSDDVLADMLIKEVKMRQDITAGGRIAVISEWDTYDGRHNYDSLRNSLYKNFPEFTVSEFRDERSADALYEKIAGNLPQGAGHDDKGIDALNRILEIPDLADELKVNLDERSWPVLLLAKKIREPDLTTDQKAMLKGFNRMLIEDLYPDAPNLSKEKMLRFSYLRGIDGQVPGDAKKEKSDTNKDKDKSDVKDDKGGASDQKIIHAGVLENPEGKSQYDYLRRIADTLYEEDRRLRHEQEKGIIAIGVLGSDFYDKYLVLQAIRQRMPQAVFFTTDLDARYLYADNLEWTKNLVVASHFGFELQDANGASLQEPVPPFRDSSQTSIFYAVLKAFEDSSPEAKETLFRANTAPHLYEIGRRHAVELKDPNGQSAAFVRTLWWKMGLLVVFGILLLCRTSITVQEFMIKKIKLFIVSVASIAVASVGLIYGLKDEPFSLTEGVSIWPADMLRLAAFIISVFSILWAYFRLERNCTDIEERYSLPKGKPRTDYRLRHVWIHRTYTLSNFKSIRQDTTSGPRGDGNFIADVLKRVKDAFSDPKSSEDADVSCLWERYRLFGSCFNRVTRVIITVVSFALFVGTLMCIFGRPYVPARGGNAFATDLIMLLASVFAFLFLTFFVVDETRLCSEFIDAVSDKKPDWPGDTIQQYLSDQIAKKTSDLNTTPNGKKASLVPQPEREIYAEWLLIEMVAKRTDVVQKLIFLPFIVWSLLFFSRSSIFDNWTTPYHLLVPILLTAVYAWSCAIKLRCAAEHVRSNSRERIERDIDKARFCDGENDDVDKKIKLLEHVLGEVKDISTGAFAPFTRHPIVQSLLLPFGSFGGVALLEFLQRFNV